MSKRAFGIAGVTCSLVICFLLLQIIPASAHCGKCLTDAKYFAGNLNSSKMTLAAATTLAEVETKGTAVHAAVQRLDKGVKVEVHCLADGKIMAVVIDGQSGKVLSKKKVNDLEAHASD